MGIRHFFAASILSALSFWGCSQTVSNSSDDSALDIPEEVYVPGMEKIDDEFEREVFFNYAVLDLAYLYSHTRNELADDYKVYLGKGSISDIENKSYCTADFYDVCYLYNQMKDPFTQYFDPYVAKVIYASVMETDYTIGIGAEAEFDSTRAALVISQVYSGSPSEKAGLKEGDIVLQVDGLHITSKEYFETMFSGDSAGTVNITFQLRLETVAISITL